MGVLGRKALPLFGIAGIVLLAAARPASAEICDLRGSTTQCTINGGIFTDGSPQSMAGLNPFLSLQKGDTAQGYNTSARSYAGGTDTEYDEVVSSGSPKNLKVADIATRTIGTKTYLEFFLDVDGSWGATATTYDITLDQLEIYVSNTAGLDNHSSSGGGSLRKGSSTTTAKKIYDLDGASTDNWVNLSYVIGGPAANKDKSDLSFLLEKSLFDGYEYVYLYSQFGDATPDDTVKDGKKTKVKDDYKYPTKSGKTEEWFTKGMPPPPSVPEPATVVLLGIGLAVAGRRLRKA